MFVAGVTVLVFFIISPTNDETGYFNKHPLTQQQELSHKNGDPTSQRATTTAKTEADFEHAETKVSQFEVQQDDNERSDVGVGRAMSTLLRRLDSSDASDRGKAAMDLYREMRQMSDQELREFWDALISTTERNPCQDDWLELTWVLNMLAHAMMERELVSHQDVDTSLSFLAQYASDPNQSAHNRRVAIQTIGMAGVSSGAPAVAALLDDPSNWEIEEIARSAVVALASLKHDGSLPRIARLLDHTEAVNIGDSAAYALGELGQLEAVPHLVAYSARTGSNLSPDTALRKMRAGITASIESPTIPEYQRIACIQATVAFFSEEHASNQDYLRPIINILEDQLESLSIRKAAGERILEHVTMVDFQTGNQILGPIIQHFRGVPELEDRIPEIEARLNAVPIETIVIIESDKGNDNK